MDYNQALRYTSESEWIKLTIEQKQDVLQTIENKIAAEDGRAAGHVLFENMPNGYYGYYDLEDPDHLHLAYASIQNAHDALNTLCHEERHAYQRHCIVNNAGVPEPIREQFKTGFDEYVAPEKNYMSYCRNFNERDANSFAEQQCNLMEIERNALLEQDEKNNEEADMIESEATEQIQQPNNHDSDIKRLYLDYWVDDPC